MKRAASILALVLAAQAPAWAQPEGADEAEAADPKAAEPTEAKADPAGEETPAPADDGQLEEAAAAKAAAEKAAAEKAAAEKAAAEKAAAEKAAAEKANLERTTKPGAAVQGAPTVDELPAWDAEPTAAPDANRTPGHELTANWDVATAPEAEVAFPWIESHGYFRLRTDLFHNFDLDTYTDGRGSSPVLPPLTETDTQGSGHTHEDAEHRYGRGADTQAGANIRFRYEPTFHITENLRVRGTFDILDNLVLGSTADGAPRSQFARPDVPLTTFSGTARPPEAGVNGWRDSVRVKYLWGEWKTPVGLLMFGRTKSHWGLGLLANNGGCLDCDFGDAVDRIMGVTKLFGTYLALGWDFPSEGATGLAGQQNLINQPFGQPYDFDQRDDVNQFVIALFQRPLTQLEKETRKRELNELRKPVFDWGVYNVIRTHAFEANHTAGGGGRPADDQGDYTLRDTKAFAYIPDVWLSYEIRPRKNKEYKLQFEGVGIFGVIEELPQRAGRPKYECLDPTVDNIDNCESGDLIRPRRRELAQWGYALEFDARLDKLRWGFHHGIASGDDTDGFGILDKTPLDSTDPTDQEVTNFKFDRDYIVDLILFREIIGGVTNAAYYKPYIAYDLIMQDTEAWGFQLDVMFAHAMEAKATPGNEAPLGLEFDLELYVHEYDVFKWSLSYGILFPMGAFDLLDTDETRVIAEPGIAQTIQMMIGMMF